MYKKLTLLTIFILISSALTSAQIPDKFTNLQVLPKLIPKENLVKIMKSFNDALGVDCSFCHAEQKGTNKLDFPSDDKSEKEESRIMVKMVMGINNDYLSQLSEYTQDISKVKCVTCHRGNKKPLFLEDVLFSTIKEKGLPAAVSAYHRLNDEYYGSFTFDFTPPTLVKLVEMLNDDNRYDDAVGIANLNIEMYPESGMAYYGLGEAFQAKGDKDNALKSYEKAKALMPEGSRFIDRRIQELKE